eukprot:EG_transcript_36127
MQDPSFQDQRCHVDENADQLPQAGGVAPALAALHALWVPHGPTLAALLTPVDTDDIAMKPFTEAGTWYYRLTLWDQLSTALAALRSVAVEPNVDCDAFRRAYQPYRAFLTTAGGAVQGALHGHLEVLCQWRALNFQLDTTCL